MVPPRPSLDPEGLYARLGVNAGATQADIVAAFRGKARLLHPDVPKTGDAGAFVRMKQAYDVLSNRALRSAYDSKAREAAERPQGVADRPPRTSPPPLQPHTASPPPPPRPAATDWNASSPVRAPRLFDASLMVWIGLAVFLCVCLYQATVHLLAPPPMVHDKIPPNAATVAPLSPSAHEALLYGPPPVRLAGNPNFYVVPVSTPAMLWRLDSEHSTLVPMGQLPPFSSVQAIRLIRRSGMLEVLINDHANGFVSADHVTPGNVAAARRAYCGYNAGPPPYDGEVLERRGNGNDTLEMENRAVQPVVVKLRDSMGAVALAVFLGPGSHAALSGLPSGTYRPEFAIGELWSRACSSFAGGMRARRMQASLTLPGAPPLVVAAEDNEPATTDIPDQVFERN
ncbi:MAG TPA: J domain-containing protein [Rhodopila sp.]|nr:J domain-containing protein [Rhodopila sp.]